MNLTQEQLKIIHHSIQNHKSVYSFDKSTEIECDAILDLIRPHLYTQNLEQQR